MLKSYLVTAWRNIKKNKVFSFINIAGLSVGMAACLLILQYVNFELSFDQFNKNIGDIYRVTNDRYQNGKRIQHGTITYSAIGKAMQDDYPEVVNHARVMPIGSTIITFKNKKITDQATVAVDNSFLDMFSYPIISGDAKTPLKDPFAIVITQSAADKYFDIKNNNYNQAIGKLVVMGRDSMPYKVTAVCKDVPENSHLSFDILVSYVTVYSGKSPYKEADYDFTDSDFWHYIQLKHGTDYKALEAKLGAFSNKHFQGNKVSGSVEKFFLQPLAKAHLYSDYEYEIGNTGSATVVWGMLIIAVFIIIIAWVNYINLTTGRSAERAREVGVRKVTGATKQQLVRQFLTESFLINVIALVLAVAFMFLLQPAFNTLVGHKLSYMYLLQKSIGGFSVTIGLAALMLAGIFVSGFYPAFVLSSFRPIQVLKGKFTTSKKGILLRQVLVVGQFAITVALIIGSFVVYRQIRFMNQQDLGMNINQMMVLQPPLLTNFDSTLIDKENSFKQELKRIPGIMGVSTISGTPGRELGRAFDFSRIGTNTDVHFTVRAMGADADYLSVYQIKLLTGRNFAQTDYNADFGKLHNVLLNKSAVKLLGFKSNGEALGKQVNLFQHKWDVVGVINDVHQKSLRYALEPTVILPTYGLYNPISVKVDPKNITAIVAAVKKQYAAFFPGNVFNYSFLDEGFNRQYANDQLFGKAFSIFSAFAIGIACLGLLGLALFATAQRTKEIGVRKVLGASVSSIVLLLSKDFIRLVLVAFVIASPIAYFVMHNWLKDFAYRINIEWWVFAIAGLLAIFIAMATISFQAIRAAMMNPVKSLKSE